MDQKINASIQEILKYLSETQLPHTGDGEEAIDFLAAQKLIHAKVLGHTVGNGIVFLFMEEKSDGTEN